jgi:hypothetical protein
MCFLKCISYYGTSWYSVCIEHVIVVQLVGKLFNGTQIFITLFTRTCHWTPYIIKK